MNESSLLVIIFTPGTSVERNARLILHHQLELALLRFATCDEGLALCLSKIDDKIAEINAGWKAPCWKLRMLFH